MDHPAQQYYNPNLTDTEERALLRCNFLLLLQTCQAALGLIGPNMFAIAVEPQTEAVVLHFAVTASTPEIEEDIDDIADELDTFLYGGSEGCSTITTQIHVGQPDDTWPGRSHTLFYLAKSTTE